VRVSSQSLVLPEIHGSSQAHSWRPITPYNPHHISDLSMIAQALRDKASVFFFIRTYFEKQIRDAMLSVVNDGIPVHDAIYSKRQLPFVQLEQAVLDVTEFEVKVGN